MLKLIENIINHYLTRDLSSRIIMLLMVSGIALIGQSFIGVVFEHWLKVEYQIELPDLIPLGVLLVSLGILIYFYNLRYKLALQVFNTEKTSRCIYLGNKKYQFIFDRRMRCIPTICFTSPNHHNRIEITNWSDIGFTVKFHQHQEIDNISFWADSWLGLNKMQKFFLGLINLFLSHDSKIKATDYEKKLAGEQIQKINSA